MRKLIYYINRVFGADYKGMFSTIGKISKRSKRSRVIIFFDVIIASIRYGAGYTDYFLFYFENLNHSQRQTYITRTVNNSYLRAMNDSSFYDTFWDKEKFNNRFKAFIKRDFLIIKDNEAEFKKFIKKHPIFISKIIKATGGVGVEKHQVNNKTNLKKLFNELIKKDQCLIEEYVNQHQTMNELCPASVNTLRIVTARKNGKTTILLRVIRVGNGKYEVDNFHKGGMFTIFNDEGIITKPAVDREGTLYQKHPMTKTEFIGFKIPYYKETIEMCIKASEIIPEVGLVGWDIAITPNGPLVIEGNELPGYDLYQSKVHLDENMQGLKPLFDQVIYGDNQDD